MSKFNNNQNLPKNWQLSIKYVGNMEFKSPELVNSLLLNHKDCKYNLKEIEQMEKIRVLENFKKNDKTKTESQSNLLPKQKNHPIPNSIKIESLINVPKHPAYPYFGLFATRNLKPDELITPYYGFVTTVEDSDDSSDYCLRLNCLAIDANTIGNLGRYVNDYRGILDKPNAEFREFINLDYNRVEMGIFVMKSKNAKSGIKKNTEICVSYGKSFWKTRNLYI
ncbi:hypothetical protein BB559_007451 [Furculomyces boomerangus]|uniref:SET domain-containing protein n=1 Tax=Furculomyces boomerangus TaxID=61424 RepID=A0A2T9XX97_9FUNG|nr:hypothetical protein BB559_007451 [Furculomyces boomerangus]